MAGLGLALAAGAALSHGGAARDRQPSRWFSTVARLESARAGAVTLLDPARLAAVYAPGAWQLAVDARHLAVLRADGAAAVRGYAPRVLGVQMRIAGADRAVLLVRDELPPYAAVDAGASVLHRFPGRGARGFVVVLTRRPGGRWRVAAWTPAQ